MVKEGRRRPGGKGPGRRLGVEGARGVSWGQKVWALPAKCLLSLSPLGSPVLEPHLGRKHSQSPSKKLGKFQLLIVPSEFLRLLSNGDVNLGTSIRGTWRGAGANRLSQSYKQRPLTKHCTLYCVGICWHKQRFETNWLAVVGAQATEITKSYNRTLDTIWNIHKLLRSINAFIYLQRTLLLKPSQVPQLPIHNSLSTGFQW